MTVSYIYTRRVTPMRGQRGITTTDCTLHPHLLSLTLVSRIAAGKCTQMILVRTVVMRYDSRGPAYTK